MMLSPIVKGIFPSEFTDKDRLKQDSIIVSQQTNYESLNRTIKWLGCIKLAYPPKLYGKTFQGEMR